MSLINVAYRGMLYFLVICSLSHVKGMGLPEELMRPEQTYNEQLHRAVAVGDLNKIKLALSQGANVNSVWKFRSDKIERPTPLIRAIINSNIDIIRFLLDNGAHSNHAIKWDSIEDIPDRLLDEIPLSIAVRGGHPEIVRLLLDYGAEFITNNKDVLTMLWAGGIIGAKEPEIKRLLSMYNIKIPNWGRDEFDAPGGLPSFADMSESDNHESLFYIDITKKFFTPLEWAAALGRVEEVKRLLAINGLSANEKQLALAYAAGNKNKNIVRTLLHAGANPVCAFHVVSGVLRRTHLSARERVSYQEIFNLLDPNAIQVLIDALRKDKESLFNKLPEDLTKMIVCIKISS